MEGPAESDAKQPARTRTRTSANGAKPRAAAKPAIETAPDEQTAALEPARPPARAAAATATATGARRTAVLPSVEVEPKADPGADPEVEAVDEELAAWLAGTDDPDQEHALDKPRRIKKRTGKGRRPLRVAAVVVVVAVLGGLGWQVQHQRTQINQYKALNAQRATVLKVASKAAIDMTTYNYKSLPTFFSTIEAESTANYITTVQNDKTLLTDAFTEGHASSTATVAGSGISSITANNAVVVLFVDQTVTNTLTKTPTKDLSRVQLTLVRQKGKWLVDQVSLP